MRESPRVVSRQEIEREIWGNGLPDSDTLRSHLYNLRKTIDKPYDKPLLHTVQSAGYRIADIEQPRSEEHTSELQSLMRISYAVFCLTHKKIITHKKIRIHQHRQQKLTIHQ